MQLRRSRAIAPTSVTECGVGSRRPLEPTLPRTHREGFSSLKSDAGLLTLASALVDGPTWIMPEAEKQDAWTFTLIVVIWSISSPQILVVSSNSHLTLPRLSLQSQVSQSQTRSHAPKAAERLTTAAFGHPTVAFTVGEDADAREQVVAVPLPSSSSSSSSRGSPGILLTVGVLA